MEERIELKIVEHSFDAAKKQALLTVQGLLEENARLAAKAAMYEGILCGKAKGDAKQFPQD